MMKKATLIISTLLSASLLIGGAFAAYAVTDQADPFGINITPGDMEEDKTKYTTLEWGDKTSLNNIENVTPGHVYKAGIVSLKSTLNYYGALSITIKDETVDKDEQEAKFINYLKFYLYEGATEEVQEDNLPETGLISSTSLGGTSIIYDNALGTSAGKEYSIYFSYDSSALPFSSQMVHDVIGVEVDWSPLSTDIDDTQKTIYFATTWDECYLYAWKDNSANASYPGVQLTKIGVNQYDQNIYEGILLDGFTNMIFSNGSTDANYKTNDLKISDYDFGDGDLLFYRNNDGSAGSVVFDPSMIVNS